MLYFVLGIFLLFVLIITSKIQVEIQNLSYVSNASNFSNVFNIDKIRFKLLILGKVPLFIVSINKKWLDKTSSKHVTSLINKIKKGHRLSSVANTNPKTRFLIKRFELNAKIGTDSTVLTAMLVPTISSAISFILASLKDRFAKPVFYILPVYNNGNVFSFNFSGIFEFTVSAFLRSNYRR